LGPVTVDRRNPFTLEHGPRGGRREIDLTHTPDHAKVAVADPARWGNIAVVHDYITQFGGAERVVLSILRALPGAPLYTSLFEPTCTYSTFTEVDVRTLPLDNVRTLRRNHRLAFPLLAPSFSRLRVPEDVVICSSSGWAHGVKATGRKIVYCHSPAKWLHEPRRYFADGRGPGRALAAVARPLLMRWDRRAVATAHRYLANSTATARLMRAVYGVDAEVLPAPHSLDPAGPQRPLEGVEPGFYLCVSRLMPYKHVDEVVEAFRGLPHERLVVVGSGPQAAALRQRGTGNVTFRGAVDDATLAWLYQNCRALIAASHEDFGLTPLEAAAFGRPAAVLRWGGFLDTVVEGRTGLFFDHPRADQIRDCVRLLSECRWDRDAIVGHAEEFSEARFSARLHEVVAEELART
jgi:glycosyltransferase involved in cell wall biosynthesis